MSYETGAVKYSIKTPLTVAGFIAMYIFGGGIMSIIVSLPHIIGGEFINAAIAYFLNEALPPTSIAEVLIQTALGSIVAATKWYFSVK